MFTSAIAIAGTAASGLVAGVFLAVALSVVPTLSALPVASYVDLHLRLGKGYHPTMPLIVLVLLLCDLWLLVTQPGGVRLLYLAAVVGTVGVQAVSHLRNEQLNRTVRAVAGQSLAGWADPRPAWRAWHHCRLALALLAFALNAIGSVALR